MSEATTQSKFKYDAFISYSRKDSEFARRVEQALTAYKPPKDLAVPQRHLRVFRDESDFQGVEYHSALDRNLKEAAKLIAICSPNSARSDYVDDEIRRFGRYRGKDHIIPVLIAGLPNNEAKDEDADVKAFPTALVELLPIPLANDYRGFDARTDKVPKGRFAHAWLKTLADIYVDYGVDRSQIEQREQKRKARNLRIVVGTVSLVGAALVALTIWALISREAARQQRDLALARQYETEARLAFDNSGEGLVKATLLSVASLQSSVTLEGFSSLMNLLSLWPRSPAWKQILPEEREDDFLRLAFSPDGSMLASAGANGVVQFWDAKSGRAIKTIEETRFRNVSKTSLAFSPDGKYLAFGCEHQTCVIDLSTWQIRTRLPQVSDGANHGTMVWSVSFSPDGQRLATASYGSNEVHLYDTATWRLVTHIAHAGHTVRSAAFSPDGKTLATWEAGSNQLRLWRTGMYEKPAAEVHVAGSNIAFGPKGDRLATDSGELWNISADAGGEIKIERASRGRGASDQIHAVPNGDDQCFVAGGRNTAVYLLCGDPLQEALRVTVSTGGIAVSPDGHWLAVRSGRALALWPLDRGGSVARIALGSRVKAIVIGGGQDWLAAGAEDGSVAIIDTRTWQKKKNLKVSSSVADMRVSSDARWLIVCTNAAVHVIDAITGLEIAKNAYENGASWAAPDLEKRWLVVMSGTRMSVLDSRNWREQVHADHDGPIDAIRITTDGKSLATVTAAQFTRGIGLIRPTKTRVWRLTDGKEIAWEYDEKGDLARNSRYHLPNDEKFRKVPRVWGQANLIPQTNTWEPLFLRARSQELGSGDHRWLTDASPFSSSITLKDSRTGRVVGALPHPGGVHAVAFVPNTTPRWLVSAGTDGNVRVWPLTPDDLIAEACARVRPNLEKDEWARHLAGLAKMLGNPIQPCA
jgi:WD40 repeat protein